MIYTTSDQRTWSSKVSAYRHEAAINPNPELRRYYAQEADKCIRAQHSLLGKLCSIPFLPLAMIVQGISGNNPLDAVTNLFED